MYVPEVGISSAAMVFSSVVLPEPEGPRRATISPCSMESEISSRALTSVSSSP